MIDLILLLAFRIVSYLVNLMSRFLGKLIYFCRGHDSALITNYPAFEVAQLPRFNVTCNDCGPPGSTIPDRYTSHAEHGNATFPTFRWTPPPGVNVAEYALVCEDPDIPVPGCSQAISIIYNIAANKNQLNDNDVRNAKDPDDTSENIQLRWISDAYDSPWTGPSAPLGHGTHRCFFTVIALNAHIQLDRNRPLNKDRFAAELVGRVVGWGQWHGVFRAGSRREAAVSHSPAPAPIITDGSQPTPAPIIAGGTQCKHCSSPWTCGRCECCEDHCHC